MRLGFRVQPYKSELFLLSLILLTIGQLFVPIDYKEIGQSVFIILTIVASQFLFTENRLLRNIQSFFLVFALGFGVLKIFYTTSSLQLVSSGLYLLYFLLMASLVYRAIFQAQDIGVEMVAAVFSGFIMLSLIGSFVFFGIELLEEGSFGGLGLASQLADKYESLQYYSFMTTLTIGFGDITPISQPARQATILMGLLGNFYSVFVIGVIISNFKSLGR